MKLSQIYDQLENLVGPSRALQVWQDCYDLAETVHQSPDKIVSFCNSLYRRCVKAILQEEKK
jgi:hypothetical protein